jgi:hypothetical protein
LKNKILVSLICFFGSQIAIAQVLPEPSLTPIGSEIEIRYRPTFSAICKDKTEKKEKGDWFAKKAESTYLKSVVIEKGIPLVKFEITGGREYFRFVMQLDESGKPANKKPTFETNAQLDEPTKIIIEAMALSIEKGAPSFYGKKVSQGEKFNTPACPLFGGITKGEPISDFRALGESIVNGRKSVVFGGTQSETCYANGKALTFSVSGWFSYDLESGLELQSSSKVELTSFEGQPLGYEIKNASCNLRGQLVAPVKENPAVQPDREKRLSELRKLLDDGLIDKAQFDKKVEEILRSL